MPPKAAVSSHVQKALTSIDTFWPGRLDAAQKEQLTALVEQHEFSVAAGDLTLINRKWYVTHSGLLRLARKNRCSGIQTEMVSEFCDPAQSRWVVKAIVYKTSSLEGVRRIRRRRSRQRLGPRPRRRDARRRDSRR